MTRYFDAHYFFRRCFLPLTLSTLLAGCGGVQDEAEGVRTLTIDGRGSSYLAVQDMGAWRALTVSGTPQQLTLTDPQGRYGVMSLCLDEKAGNLSVNVQHGVVSQTPVVSAGCPADDAPATVSVSGTVTGLAEGDYGNVYLGHASALLDSTSGARLELPEARYDLVASRYSGEARVPNRLVFLPGQWLADGAEVEVDFNGPFSFHPEVEQLAVLGIRSGELLSGSVELVTPGGTAARIGEYTGGNILAYAGIPAGLETSVQSGQNLVQGADLRAEVQSFSYNDRTKAGSSRSVAQQLGLPSSSTPQAPLQISLLAPLSPPKLTLYGDAYLRPQASWQVHPAGGGVYTQFYSQIRNGHTVSCRLSQSSAWLAGRAPSYALPDFSALSDWQSEWNLIGGKDLFWDVSLTQKTPLTELVVSRSGVITP